MQIHNWLLFFHCCQPATEIHEFLAESLPETLSDGNQEKNALDRDVGVAVKKLLDPVAVSDHATLAVKHLHPSTTLTELLHVSAAFVQPVPVPSYSTFLRMYSSGVVRFRHESQHAKCSDCERFKAWKRTCSTNADAALVAKAYMEHLQAVMRDRAADAVWRLQGSNAMTTGVASLNLDEGVQAPSWLCVTIDGMDCSKFAVPLNICKSKEFAKMERPELKLTLAISEGHEEAYYLMDPTLSGTANVDLTIIADMIARSYDEAKSRGVPFPTGLRLHADNCSAELRNQSALKFGCWLIHRRVFDQVALTFFVVGHSHGLLIKSLGKFATACSRRMCWSHRRTS